MRSILKIAPLAFFIAISFNTAVFAGYNIQSFKLIFGLFVAKLNKKRLPLQLFQ